MKLIFKFKSIPIDESERERIEKIIKDFHNESLILFGNDIEITVLENENNDKENNS